MIAWLLVLVVVGPQADAGDAYLAAVARADSLYGAGRLEPALAAYREARVLLPDAVGPRVGIAWTLLKLGEFASAESAFAGVLTAHPDNAAAREGLRALPRSYHWKFTGSFTDDFGTTRVPAGFVEYNDRFRTTVTFGLQSVSGESAWQGFNTALALYHRLRNPWSLRFDFLTIAAFNSVRYWHVVYAPAVGYRLGEMHMGLTLVGWDNLDPVGTQLEVERPLDERLSARLVPFVGVSDTLFNWFVPLDVRFTHSSWLSSRLGAGIGSVADYVDLNVPTVYNQSERLVMTVRGGVDVTPFSRCLVTPFIAWERYDDGSENLYASLTASVRL